MAARICRVFRHELSCRDWDVVLLKTRPHPDRMHVMHANTAPRDTCSKTAPPPERRYYGTLWSDVRKQRKQHKLPTR